MAGKTELSHLLFYIQRTLPHARLVETCLPQVPEIDLWLIDPVIMHRPLPDTVIHAVLEQPAYWAFCWASGQALARYILDNPLLVQDKVVLDFGCGSAVAGLAAKKAGAKQVIACDIDDGALSAAKNNMMLNDLTLTLCSDLDAIEEPVDVLLAADVLYDRENYPLIDLFRQKAEKVIIADSRIRDFNGAGYQFVKSSYAETWPDMGEFEEFKWVRFYESL